MKLALKIIGGIILFLIALFVAIKLYFNSARLKKTVLPRLDQAIGRKVKVGHMSLTFFKTFPHPGIEIDRMMVPGKTPQDTLLSLKRLAIGVKLFPLIHHNVEITELDINQPNFTYIIYPDSSTNLDFLLNQPQTDTTSSGYNIAIPYFQIHNGHFGYRDLAAHTKIIVDSLGGSLSLSYGDSIKSDIDVKAKRFTAVIDSSHYLSGLPLSLSEKSTLYPDREYLRLNKGYFAVHGLKLNLAGTIENWDKTPKVNLKFNSSSSDFGALLKLLPQSYHQYTKNLKAKGKLTLNGTINGAITGNHFPDFHIKMNVRHGSLEEPKLQQPVKNIRFTARADKKALIIDTLHAEAGENRLSGSGKLANPLKDNGTFHIHFLADADLSTLHQFYDLSQMSIARLGGKLTINLNSSGRRSKLSRAAFSGRIDLSNGLLKYKKAAKSFTPINIHLNGNQKVLHVQQFELKAGKNSFTLQGTIDNLPDKKRRSVNLNTNLRVSLAGMKDYYPINTDSMQLGGVVTAKASLNGPANPVTAAVKSGRITIKNGMIKGQAFSRPVKNLNGTLLLTAGKATLKQLSLAMGSSRMKLKGSLTHYPALFKDEKDSKTIPEVKGQFFSSNLNLDELMNGGGGSLNFKPELPNLNTSLTATIKQLEIAGVTMHNLQAKATTTPKQVHLVNASVQLFGGNASGTMRWKIPGGKPSTFHFKGSLDSLQLKAFFKQYHILGKNSDFYKYISGRFNAQANYTTKIDTSLSPLIATTALTGTFGMSKAHIKNQPVQQKLAEFTHIKQLNDIELDKWQSSVDIHNKVLTLKNLSLSSHNIGFELNGTQELATNQINFHTSLHLPEKFQSAITSLLSSRVMKVLRRPDGSMIIPLKFSGQYSDPSVKLDKSIIESRLKKTLKNKAGHALKNLFNRIQNHSSKTDTSSADSVKTNSNVHQKE